MMIQRALIIGAKPQPFDGPWVYTGDYEDWYTRVLSDTDVPASAIKVERDGDWARARIIEEFKASHVTVIVEVY